MRTSAFVLFALLPLAPASAADAEPEAPPPAEAAAEAAPEAAPKAAPAAEEKAPGSEDLEWAREHLHAGRYETAIERCEKAIRAGGALAGAARALLARVHLETAEAVKALAAAAAVPAKDPAFIEAASRAGEAYLALGRPGEALERFTAAFNASGETDARARAGLYLAHMARGQYEEARVANAYFFHHYQKHGDAFLRGGKKVEDAGELVALALALWDEDPQHAFDALTVAEKMAPADLEAAVLSGFLALEYYNFPEALKTFTRVLARNRRHPAAKLGLAFYQMQNSKYDLAEKAAREALEVAPKLEGAHLLLARLYLVDDLYEKYEKELAAVLEIAPGSVEALSEMGAYKLVRGDEAAYREIRGRVFKINPRCALFECTVGSALERRRRFDDALAHYREAVRLDRQHWRGHFGAGMNLLRLGREKEGRVYLEEAWKRNKFNVWCRNILQVTDKVFPPTPGGKPEFTTFKTEHFVVRVHEEDAGVIEPYAREVLEAAWARYKAKYGFEPPGPILFYFYTKQSDFAARTAGLPTLGANGACFGKVVTLSGPRVAEGRVQRGKWPYSWATVAEHEIMHAFTGQLSGQRVPRWLNEGISVYEEGYGRIEWDPMFAAAAKRGRLPSVAEMSANITRPRNPREIALAYYYSAEIVRHLHEKYGVDKLIAMVRAFADERPLGEIVKETLGLELEAFDAECKAFGAKRAGGLPIPAGVTEPADLVKLEEAAKAEGGKDAAAWMALAEAYLASRRAADAGKAAEKAVKTDPKCAAALALLGRLAHAAGKPEEARAHMEKALAPAPEAYWPNYILGRIALDADGDRKAVAALLEKARAAGPRMVGENSPYDLLAKLYKQMGERGKAEAVLRALVEIQSTAWAEALELGKLYYMDGEHRSAAWALLQCIRTNPYVPEAHLFRGRALEKLGEHAKALDAYRVAVRLEPKSVPARLGLARCALALGKADAALAAAREALALDPGNARAEELKRKAEAAGGKVQEREAPAPAPEEAPEAEPAPDVQAARLREAA